MGFKNFRLNILLRIFILTALLFSMLWSFTFTDWTITPFGCLFLSALFIIELIHYIERSNRKLKSFLSFIHHRDYSGNLIDTKEGESFSDLTQAYKAITAEFKKLNSEKEANTQYLELIVEHIKVALICLDSDANVILMNGQAKRLFNLPFLHNINNLSKLSSTLPQIINAMKNGEQELLTLKRGDEELQLSIHVTEFKIQNQYNKLVSFQNIRSELEQHEISSWEKLIRVLTHEIMNSVTPIISLSGVLKKKLIADNANEIELSQLSQEEVNDIHNCINSIESRSIGLQNFVQTYRRLTAIPLPNKSIVSISSLLNNVCTLLKPELEQRSIELRVTGSSKKENLLTNVDPQQLEQVLINLISNSMDAVAETENPSICLHTSVDDSNNVILKVIDNGCGITSEYLEQVFVPFFTTKNGGTGIGLSLSRQFCIQNKVMLSISSSKEKGCTFILQLPSVA